MSVGVPRDRAAGVRAAAAQRRLDDHRRRAHPAGRARRGLPRAAGRRGVSFGFLDADLEIDAEVCTHLAEPLPGVPWTFHRAIDDALDAERAWARVVDLPGLVAVRSAGLAARPRASATTTCSRWPPAAPQVARLLMPGGGLLGEHVPWFVRAGVRAFHLGPQARPGGTVQGVRRRRPRPVVAAAARRRRRPGRARPTPDDPDRPAQRGRARPALVAPGQRRLLRRAARLRRAPSASPSAASTATTTTYPSEWYDDDGRRRRRRRSPRASWSPGWSPPACAAASPAESCGSTLESFPRSASRGRSPLAGSPASSRASSAATLARARVLPESRAGAVWKRCRLGEQVAQDRGPAGGEVVVGDVGVLLRGRRGRTRRTARRARRGSPGRRRTAAAAGRRRPGGGARSAGPAGATSGPASAGSARSAQAADRSSSSGAPSYTASWNHAASSTATSSHPSSSSRSSTSARCRRSW